jgi:hypothetical protein
VEATDVDGTTIGAFEPRGMRRGGTVLWNGRELELRLSSAWRERYALVDGDKELAIFDGKGWGRKPVAISIGDPDALDPGLVLFAASSFGASPTTRAQQRERPPGRPRRGSRQSRSTRGPPSRP